MLQAFRKRKEANRAPRVSVPAGVRVYAIGDVHGQLDLLDALLAKIAEDRRARGPAQDQLILLGDLVDRGPASAGVVDRVRQLIGADPSVRCLMGNHEEVFAKALDGNIDALRMFDNIGGKETMSSYGMTADELKTLTYPALADRLRQLVPSSHVAFLRSLEDQVAIGDYLFVHAGIRPGVPLAEQQPSDLRWIRKRFLDHAGDHGVVVVHGHTVTAVPAEHTNRIGIDTGAGIGGSLTAIGIQSDDRWFLTASPHDRS